MDTSNNGKIKSFTKTSKDVVAAYVSLQESRAWQWSVKNNSVLSVTERGLFIQVRK